MSLGLVVPIGMRIFVENRAFVDDVFEMSLPPVTALVGGEAIEHSLIRGFLQIDVERRVDLETAFVDLISPVLAFEITANLFDEIRSERIWIVREMEDEGGGASVGSLGRGDLAVLKHGVDDQVAALLRAVRMSDRRIDGRALRESGEERGFVEGQLLGRLAEVVFRRRFEAIDAVSEKNLVGVEGEDLRLGEAALDLDGEHRFLHFALPAAVGRKKKIAGKLHGQRGRTLNFAAGFDVAVGSADDPPEIDAGVAVEILVLDGDEGVAEHRGKIVVSRDDAALQSEGSDDPIVIVVKFGD